MSQSSLGVVAVLGGKGGVGKSTVAVNLAAALALRGERTVLVDADPQGGSSLHLGTVVPPDDLAPITALVAGGRDPHDLLAETAVENLWLIAANRTLAGFENSLERVDESLLRRLESLRALGDVADFVIIDTPPGVVGRLPLIASVASDLAILVTTYDDLSVLPLHDTAAVLEAAREVNGKIELFGIVGSRFDARTSVGRAYRNLVVDVLFPGQVVAELPERARVREAQQAHVPLAVHLQKRPRDQAKDVVEEFARLADRLLERVHATSVGGSVG